MNPKKRAEKPPVANPLFQEDFPGGRNFEGVNWQDFAEIRERVKALETRIDIADRDATARRQRGLSWQTALAGAVIAAVLGSLGTLLVWNLTEGAAEKDELEARQDPQQLNQDAKGLGPPVSSRHE
ncbi:hypothetical protein [Brevundimonas sp. R86498]|uniref:hypothetical protein n=1 Tax=Brevundimonas sp. R86498 TaxID=3093845 RepID=UPI0037C669A3